MTQRAALLMDEDEDEEVGKVVEEGNGYADVDDLEADEAQAPDGASHREDLVNGDAHGE